MGSKPLENTTSWSARGLLLFGVLLLLVAGGCDACTDELSSSDCADDESWDPIEERCVAGGGGGGGDDAGGLGDDAGGGGGGGDDDAGGGGDDGGGGGPTCVGLECDQVACDDGEPITTLTGTVTVPSGDLPLPNVTVFVPNAPLQPIAQGASCERCEDMISGNPLVQTVTDFNGNFVLENVPVGEDIPLVIQTGKWRRKIEIPAVEPCTENPITDPESTRLPRNRSEGDIPRIAVTNSMWDALECLLTRLGIDEAEFSASHTDDSRVTLMTHDHGASTMSDGTPLQAVNTWWNELSNLQQYDILVYSCGYPNATGQAQEALQQFVDMGGRVFMNDLHREWFEYGTLDFQAVANWRTPIWPPLEQMQAELDTSVPGGGLMYDWMNALGRIDNNDQFTVYDIVKNIGSVNQDQAERWIYTPESSQGILDLYFAFNTPLGAPEEQQCGRVVYSDLHIAAASGSEPTQPFPGNCGGGPLNAQEEALIYMIFDLTACIAPDCVPLNCSDVPDSCGVHPNGCGGTIDCGECCVEKDEPCSVDADCCGTLWCNGDTGLCTDECRAPGESCTDSDQCCGNAVCTGSGGAEGVCLAQ